MQPTPDFENEVRTAMAVPEPDPVFLKHLRYQVSRPKMNAFLRLAWIGLAVSSAFLFLVIWLIGPGNVYAEFRGMFGFVPGIGVVQNDSKLRVLVEPVKMVRDGISLEVLKGAADDQHTVLVFQVGGIPQTAQPGSENVPGCTASPTLQLTDGSTLKSTGGEGNGWGTGYQLKATFPALPAGNPQVTLVIPCLMDTRPGSVPENWQIALRFQSAPADMQVFPVYDLTAATPVLNQATKLPTTGAITESAPALGHTAAVNGITVSLDQVAETEQGFLLQGSISKDPKTVLMVRFGLGTQLLDANGEVIPTEFSLSGGSLTDPSSEWKLQTNSKAYPGPWTLKVPSLFIELSAKVSFNVDFGPSPQIGQIWEINQTLDFAGHPLVVQKAELIEDQDQKTRLRFTFGGGSELYEVSSMGDPQNFSARSSPKLTSADSGALTYSSIYDQIPTGKRTVDIYGATLVQPGPWLVGWQPPVTAGAATPTALPQACLTETTWQQLRSQTSNALPGILSGHLLVEENTGQPMPQITRIDLSTGQKQALVTGGWSSLSPDGSRIAYIESNGQSILIAGTHGEPPQPLAGTTSTDYNPLWSPDGQWIAFRRANQGIYIIHPDGSGVKRLTGPTSEASLVGWLPDSRALVINVMGSAGDQLERVDIETGALQTMLTMPASKSGFRALSPDGAKVTFNQEIFGKHIYSTWMANLDGSGRKLLADLDSASTAAAVWSPDGKWLVLVVLDITQDGVQETPLLVQPDTCQVAALPGISGAVTAWR